MSFVCDEDRSAARRPCAVAQWWRWVLDGLARWNSGYERLVRCHRPSRAPEEVDEVVVIGILDGGLRPLASVFVIRIGSAKMVAFYRSDAGDRSRAKSKLVHKCLRHPHSSTLCGGARSTAAGARGAGKGQQIAIVIGDAEPEKFWLGVQACHHCQSSRADPSAESGSRGDHSARLTWGAQSIAWVLEQLSAWYYGESSQPPP